MKIRKTGSSGRVAIAARALETLLAHRGGELLLLPIPTTRDKIHLTGTDKTLRETLCGVGRGDAVLCYGLPEELRLELRERGVAACDASLDEEFLAENAAITADGALGRLLTGLDRAPCDLAVGIIGYGRIGSRLLSRLLFLGARCAVISSRHEVRLSLAECGVECREPASPDRFSGLDALINTAPAEVMTDGELAALLSEGVTVIDLASGHFLPDDPAVLKLSSVPDAMYPVTAGRLYAEYAVRMLSDMA